MKQLGFAGLSVALLILGAVAVLAYRSIDAAAGTLAWVEHTHAVLAQLQEVNNAYSRAVTARRVYVVAGDESQLGDRANLDARMTHAIDALRALVVDNPEEKRRVDAFEGLVGQRVAGLEASVVERRVDGTGAETAESLALTARIRAVREEIEKEENALLADRDARTRRDVARTKLAEIGGTCASFAILLAAFGRLAQEIRRRRRSEAALRASEAFLESIVENIPDMVFVKGTKELRFERINQAGEALLGIDRKDLLGKNDFDFFPADQAEAFQERDRQTLEAGAVVDVPEEPIETKGGERWLHTKKVPILDERGAPKFLLGISEDITERRKAAAALRAAKDAADVANQELEAFSYSVAHDLRAPLRAIDGFSRALAEECGDRLGPAAADYTQRVRAAARRMSDLIESLLKLSRITRGAVSRKTVDITRLAVEGGARLRDSHPDREVELVVQDGLSAEGDARLLSVVFDNLLGNAWKFTGKRDHPRVEVGKVQKDGKPAFFVRDNGAGFEQAYAGKLFGAFQRLHDAAEFEGTGIGLATVQRIVYRHGGRIWAEGQVDAGATFYFTL